MALPEALDSARCLILEVINPLVNEQRDGATTRALNNEQQLHYPSCGHEPLSGNMVLSFKTQEITQVKYLPFRMKVLSGQCSPIRP